MIWLRSLVSALTGDLGQSLARAFEAKHNARTEQDRIAVELEIARLQERQANRALGGRLTAVTQALWAAPFIIYDWKLLVWDKVLQAGVTDPLSASLIDMQIRIAMFYFGGAAVIGVVRAIRR